MIKRFTLLAIISALLNLNSFSQQIAFPGAEGAGRFTTGGRGTTAQPTTVFQVTKLTDDGSAGTLRWALTQTATYRTIVFRVSGTIRLDSTRGRLIIRNNTTIAGQTAPGDGVCIADQPVVISGDNVIVRFIRIRMGDRFQKKLNPDGTPSTSSGGDDAFGNLGNKNIIIDHCSVSWSSDEAMTFYRGDSLTLQYNIISEPLDYSYHYEGGADYQRHGYGGIWGARRGSFHHNLIAHANGRTPRLAGNSSYPAGTIETADFRNNVIYNWLNYNTNGGEGGNYNLVNNYYKPGPNTSSSSTSGVPRRAMIMNPASGDGFAFPKLYVTGNHTTASTSITANNWLGIAFTSGSLNDSVNSKVNTPFDVAPFPTTHTALEAYEIVLQNAGAILPKRDTLDQRIVNDVRNGTGRHIDVQGGYPHGTPYEQTVNAWPALNSTTPPTDTDQDGMPDSWETANGSNTNNAADRSVVESNGYTRLENYLNSIVEAAVLPLKLVSFSGSLEGKMVKLNWNTTSEVNTDNFSIERSADGISFYAIGSVKGLNQPNTSSYTFTDVNPAEGKAFYRLRTNEKDGKYSYSSIISLNVINKATLSINPNPVANTITISHSKAEPGAIAQIFSIDGTLRMIYKVDANAIQTSFDVSALPRGVYSLRFRNNNETSQQKFVKQ